MSLTSEAEKFRGEYQENVEDIDEAVDIVADVINEVLDKHGDKVGEVFGKYITSLLVPTIEQINKSKLSDEAAKATTAYCDNLFNRLVHTESAFTRDEALRIVCAAAGRR